MQAPGPKRFYKDASAFVDDEGFGVRLDERMLRTPSGAQFRVSTAALAEAIASEWRLQDQYIAPRTMPLTQFAFAAIDHAPGRRDDLVRHVLQYGETDLCCHRAEAPAALAQRQATAWDPLLAWVEERFAVGLPVVTGVIAAQIPERSREQLQRHAAELDDFRLTLLAQATGLAGSAVIGLAITHGRIDAAQAYEAALIDDLWSIEHWGEDAEARARLDHMRAEFDALATFAAALS